MCCFFSRALSLSHSLSHSLWFVCVSRHSTFSFRQTDEMKRPRRTEKKHNKLIASSIKIQAWNEYRAKTQCVLWSVSFSVMSRHETKTQQQTDERSKLWLILKYRIVRKRNGPNTKHVKSEIESSKEAKKKKTSERCVFCACGILLCAWNGRQNFNLIRLHFRKVIDFVREWGGNGNPNLHFPNNDFLKIVTLAYF